MSLASSLNVGVSALKAFSEGIQVISNNIANVNTVGYKSSTAQYSDTFSNLLRPLVPNESNTGVKVAPTQIGGGVQVEAVSPVFSQGTIQVTSSNSDLAIAGQGFFRVVDPTSGTAYVTRAGNFRVDSAGYLVTQEGFRVQGAYGATTNVVYDPVSKGFDVQGPQNNATAKITPASTAVPLTGATTTANSATVTVDDTSNLLVGMPLSGTGIIPGTTVVSITGNTFVMSNPATMTISTPSSISGSINSGSVTVTNINTAGLTVGMSVKGSGIPAGTTIASIVTSGGSGTIKLSDAATANTTSLTFSNLTATGRTVNSDSYQMTLPVDATRADLAVGQSVSGAGIPYGTTITAVTGNYKKSIPAAASPVTISGDTHGTTTVDNLSSVAGLTVGLAVTGSGIPNGTTITAVGSNSITLSNAATTSVTGLVVTAQGVKTLDQSNPVINLPSAANVMAGQSVAGAGIAPGTIVLSVGSVNPDGTYPVTLSNNPTVDSYSAVDLAFGDQLISISNRPTTNAYTTSTLTFGTQYRPATQVGSIKISFNEGENYTFVDKNGAALTGLDLAAAQLGVPKIRTFNVGTNGSINAVLSNGQTYTVGSVLLQNFKDPGALIREGQNLFSGMQVAGSYNGDFTAANLQNLIPGTKGIGVINGGALELSNVDLGEQFSNMITTQRAFQAGSRVITTTDSMLEEAVNLKR